MTPRVFSSNHYALFLQQQVVLWNLLLQLSLQFLSPSNL